MEVMPTSNENSPYKNAPDSPSRQLLWELSQMTISSQQRFHAHLDRESEARADEHRQALAVAAAKHDRVLQSVELERQRLEAQIQAERERRDNETRKELERQRREKAEREIEEKKRELERAKVIEGEQKKLAELERTKREAVEATRKQREQEQERADAARREQERRAAEQKQREDAQKQQPPPAKASSTAQPNKIAVLTPPEPAPAPSIPTPAPPQPSSSTASDNDSLWEAEHNQYLEIHQKLKELRKFMNEQGKTNKQLKTAMGEMRRGMRKCVGQLTEGKGANTEILKQILALLRSAVKFQPQPVVPIAPFLATSPTTSTPGPGLLIYLLSIFSKLVIGQFIDEASVSPKRADPVGIVASHIFALPDFQWQNTSTISILIAKFHAVCPVLFGIYGPENTVKGKERLGWWREESRTAGPFVSTQRHYERMTGIGAGFASLALRNYEKSKLRNPYPDGKYWEALAKISATPSEGLTQTHFVVLKAIVQGYEDRFVKFYGNAAVAALRLCLVSLPERAPEGIKGTAAVKGCSGLVDVIRKERKLVL